MTFPMTDFLRDYDVYPLVFSAGKEATVHIRPLGCDEDFTPGKEYIAEISAISGGSPHQHPATADFNKMPVVCNENGGFDITYTFPFEQQYFIRIFDESRKIKVFAVYAVEKDLQGRYPLRGDLHIHTTCSDGRQTPEVVCANYRSHGYDFFAITDHHRYYPSLKAIDFYKDIPTEFLVVPGEEIHIADVNGKYSSAHIVNFGGLYSINALVKDRFFGEFGEGDKFRSIIPNPPTPMTVEEYSAKMEALAEKIQVPENIDKIPAATMKWGFGEIKKADGLAIFPHPFWITNDTFHVPDAFVEYLMSEQDFDAFEVLGGERYFEHNGYQTIRYYEDKAKGRNYPIVGSTDSHNSYESAQGSLICSTLVFSPKNERKALINSIKDFYSVAVDSISKEFRLVGDSRLVRYSCFLINNYLPRHDEACFEEGRLMKICATGTPEEKEDAIKTLAVINGRIEKMRIKYFCF